MKQLLLSLLFIAASSTLFAQEVKPTMDANNSLGSATKSAQFTIECVGEVNPPSADLKWRPILYNKRQRVEHETPNKARIDSITAANTKLPADNKTNPTEATVASVTPIVGTNYLGNINNGSAPMDNNIAISNGGWIVSVANTTIEYDDMNGTNYYYNDIVTFLNDGGITNVCDPVVLYDPGADRFVFFAQECSGNSANTWLLILFSKTNNPNDGWWYYKLTGDPLSDNSWFDYPKIAVSTNELYITGNLFDNALNFNEAVLYQIDKWDGYAGTAMTWQYWSGISGSPFTLLPVSHGQNTTYGPGCYLVATDNAGASSIQLYDLTDDIGGSPSLNYYSVSTTSYNHPGFDCFQNGTTVKLDAGDCRALSGFYLNGLIHFVFHSEIGSSYWGINYNRLNPTGLTNTSSMFGLAGTYDYCYPSVASFATSPTDKSVMIGFGRTGSTIYPQVRVVNCDNAMNWSSSTLVKSSSDYVCYSSGCPPTERWGDYTGMHRKHNASSPSVWMNGMYGTSSNKWNTWNAEIHGPPVGIEEANENSSLTLYPNPVIENFQLEFTLSETTDLDIQVLDINGKTVQNLYSGTGLQGTNVFSFNKANLSSGTYFLTIQSPDNIIANEKIVIAN